MTDVPDQGSVTHAQSGSGADGRRSQPTNLTLIGALNIILQARVLIASWSIAVFLLVVVVVLLMPRTFTASSSFMPQSRTSTPSIAGLAAQFGLAVPGADPSQSPAFYSDLVKTREILGGVVDSRYPNPSLGRPDSVSLVDVFGNDAPNFAERREAAILKLQNSVSTDVSLKTGVIELTVDTRFATLSMQVNGRILDLVNDFNLRKRQSQAGDERRFVQRRVDEVQVELRADEDRLQVFLQANRDYRNSPGLAFEHDRLDRAVQMQQQLYTTLAQSLEQARIDEIRDNPVITIIEQPTVPLKPNGRGLLRKGMIALLAGLLLGLGIAFGRYALRQGSIGDAEELSEFRRLAANTIRGIPRNWRGSRRLNDEGGTT